MGNVKNFVFGMLIGIANIIPGVSGGTMAVMLNIYDRLLLSLSIKNFKKNLPFLAALGCGAAGGMFAFSRVITYMYENYYMIVNFCFIGLIIGSMPMIYRRARFGGIEKKNWIPFVMAFIFMIAVTIFGMMEGANEGGGTAAGVESLDLPIMLIWLFIAAFISTIAMILPGISGSFMLLLFGCYAVVMKAIAELEIVVLLCVALGVAGGGLVGVQLVKIMLSRHPQAMYFSILGLVAGSVFTIYPGFTFDVNGAAALLGMAVCAAVSYGFDRFTSA
ncbi:MAG: DUF368 domain-containing protein [Anaerovoracaceae bacterium]